MKPIVPRTLLQSAIVAAALLTTTASPAVRARAEALGARCRGGDREGLHLRVCPASRI